MLDRLFLYKIIFIFKLKLLAQKLETLAVTVFQVYRFLYLLFLEGATPTIASPTIFVQNIYIETVVTCTKFVVSCCYNFSNIPILLLAYDSTLCSTCGRGASFI